MNNLERKAMRLFEEFGLQKINTIVTIYGGVVGVRCAIRWKDSGEVCGRDICIMRGDLEGKEHDDDFFFHVENLPHFLSLLANLDFVYEDFDTESDWLEEIDKYVCDKDDYFNSREDFDIVDLSEIYIADEGSNGDDIIGRKEVVEGGIKYTPDRTDNGYAFKDLKAIAKRSGICYIAEVGFDNGELVLTPDNTWEHINNGAVETYESAMRLVKNEVSRMFHGFATDCNFALYMEFIHWITDSIFQEVDYQCFDSRLNEYDLEENLTYFLESKFVDFAKKRLKQDGDDTEYADDDDLWDKLSNYLGRYCYRHDDFSLTDWDDLIDKWEDEPNY